MPDVINIAMQFANINSLQQTPGSLRKRSREARGGNGPVAADCGHGCSSAHSHRYRSDEMAESFASKLLSAYRQHLFTAFHGMFAAMHISKRRPFCTVLRLFLRSTVAPEKGKAIAYHLQPRGVCGVHVCSISICLPLLFGILTEGVAVHMVTDLVIERVSQEEVIK